MPHYRMIIFRVLHIEDSVDYERKKTDTMQLTNN